MPMLAVVTYRPWRGTAADATSRHLHDDRADIRQRVYDGALARGCDSVATDFCSGQQPPRCVGGQLHSSLRIARAAGGEGPAAVVCAKKRPVADLVDRYLN